MSGYRTIPMLFLVDDAGRPVGLKEANGNETFFPTFNPGQSSLVKPDGSTAAVGGGGGVVAASDIAFATSVPLTQAGNSFMPQTTVTGPLAFTPAASAVKGALVYLRLVADGTNAPTFSGFLEWGGSSGYLNTAGIVNQVQFFHDGHDSWYSVSQAVGAVAAPAPDTTAPTLSSPTGTSTGTTTGSGSVTTNEGNGTLYYLATTNATETAATVKASGATQAVSSTGTKSVTVSGLTPSTTYYLHFVHRDAAGNDSAVSNSTGFTTSAVGDTTAPTLSSPTGTSTGTTTASGSVSTNEGNGTLYYLASTNATESAATVKAGQSQAVTGTGTQNVSFTGLTASTTYYAHYVHRDAAGNDSTVSNSASFTTSAAATDYPRLTSLSATTTESGTGPYTYTGNGGALASDSGGITTKSLPANTDGWLEFIITVPNEVILGFRHLSTATIYSNHRFGLYANGVNGGNPNSYRRIGTLVSSGPNAAGLSPQTGDILRLTRSGNILKTQVARSATPTTFVDLDTVDYGSAPQLWVDGIAYNTAAFQLKAWSGFA